MKRYTELLPNRIKQINKELVSDLDLSDMNIRDKALKSPGIKAKYLQILFEEQALLEKLKDGKDKLTDEYVNRFGAQGIPKFKTSKEASSDEKIVQVSKAINEQKEIVRFITEAYKIVSGFNFEISNAVKLIALEQ